MGQPAQHTDDALDARDGGETGRRALSKPVMVVLALVVVAIIVAVIVMVSGMGRGVGTGPNVVNPPAISGTPVPSPAVTDPSAALPERDPAALDQPVEVVPQVTVSLSDFESVEGESAVPGEIAGPAVRVHLTVKNATETAVDLSQVVVNAYYGPDRTPALPLTEPGGSTLPATVAAGGSADAVLLFTIPVDQRDAVTITVDYLAGVPAAVFSGPVPA